MSLILHCSHHTSNSRLLAFSLLKRLSSVASGTFPGHFNRGAGSLRGSELCRKWPDDSEFFSLSPGSAISHTGNGEGKRLRHHAGFEPTMA